MPVFSNENIILIFVAPTFKNVFAESDKPLPLPTIILFNSSDFMIENKNTIFLFLSLIGFITIALTGERMATLIFLLNIIMIIFLYYLIFLF